VECGVTSFPVHRAGNFGANLDTLLALKEIGIRCDSSFNPAFAHSFPDIHRIPQTLGPVSHSGVLEFPVSNFIDYKNCPRHAQINASGFDELRIALLAAWRARSRSFSIFLHSFEFLHRSNGKEVSRAVPIVKYLSRFERLCQFLSRNRDKFVTATFAEATNDDVPKDLCLFGDSSIKVPFWATGRRYIEQFSVKYIS